MQDKPDNSPSDPGSTPPAVPVPINPAAPVAPAEPETDGTSGEPATSPPWANDLRRLYNAVVEEPLPDSLIELLSQLDDED